jgi:hypothetical protein
LGVDLQVKSISEAIFFTGRPQNFVAQNAELYFTIPKLYCILQKCSGRYHAKSQERISKTSIIEFQIPHLPKIKFAHGGTFSLYTPADG